MPFLSIVIIAKNEEKVLPALLESIKRQTFKDHEIIVADAQSTDKTTKVAEKAGAKVVAGGRPGSGRNRGAEAASGSMLLFLDADGELPSEKFLEESLAEMKERGACVATTYIKPLSDKPIDYALLDVCNAYNTIMERIKPHAPGACIFVKKHVHEAIRGFDESLAMAEDHDYVQRAEKAGYRFRILRSQPIGVSVRRLEKDGRWGIAIKYIKSELIQMVEGPHKEMPFAYAMGGGAEDKEKLERPLSHLVDYLSKIMDTEIDLTKVSKLTKDQLNKLKDIL
jgi:glycosyltransferase involved in cell wall biosynthesis